MKIINGRKTSIILFQICRITAPYIFLRTADYMKHEGSKPINITWRLNIAIHHFLQKGSKTFTLA